MLTLWHKDSIDNFILCTTNRKSMSKFSHSRNHESTHQNGSTRYRIQVEGRCHTRRQVEDSLVTNEESQCWRFTENNDRIHKLSAQQSVANFLNDANWRQRNSLEAAADVQLTCGYDSESHSGADGGSDRCLVARQQVEPVREACSAGNHDSPSDRHLTIKVQGNSYQFSSKVLQCKANGYRKVTFDRLPTHACSKCDLLATNHALWKSQPSHVQVSTKPSFDQNESSPVLHLILQPYKK